MKKEYEKDYIGLGVSLAISFVRNGVNPLIASELAIIMIANYHVQIDKIIEQKEKLKKCKS